MVKGRNSQLLVCEQLFHHMRKDKIRFFYLSPYTKITSRWAKDLHVKQQLYENFRRNFKRVSFLEWSFFKYSLKAKITKESIDKVY